MDFLMSSFVTFTVAMLLFTVVGGIYGRGPRRAFLGGFAIGAWGYFIISYGPYNLNTLGNQLLTNEAIEFVSTSWLGEPPSYARVPYSLIGVNNDPSGEARWRINLAGNCAFILSSGLLCGFAAIRFTRGASRYETACNQRPNALTGADFPTGEVENRIRSRELVGG